MAFGAGGGTGDEVVIRNPKIKREQKLEKSLVVEDVKVVEKKITIEVPVLKTVEKEQTKYVTKEEPQTRYKTVVKETTKYVPREEDTIKYRVKEEGTVKYIPKDVEVERPIPVDKSYERPIIKEKVIEVTKIGDVEAVQLLVGLVRELTKSISELTLDMEKVKVKLSGLKEYKLVEQIIKAPKIVWETVPVERVVYKDVIVKREVND